MPTDNVSQMKKGLLEFAILLIIARKEVYASEIIEELKAAHLIVVEGTLYPLLSRIRRAEYIEYFWVESESGPPRKYYKLTSKGKAALKIQTQSWNQLILSIQALRGEL